MRCLVPVLLLAAACGSGSGATVADAPSPTPSSTSSVQSPPCGQRGANWQLSEKTGTVRHADCDLTGVTLTFHSAGAEVPPPGEGTSATPGCVQASECYGITVTTATNGDVAWKVTD